jgi:hypothetical protein
MLDFELIDSAVTILIQALQFLGRANHLGRGCGGGAMFSSRDFSRLLVARNFLGTHEICRIGLRSKVRLAV